MKKLFLIGALFCASAGILATSSYHIITTCGYQFNTSGPDGYPGGETAWLSYLTEMNKHYCGTWVRPQYFKLNDGDDLLIEP